MELTTLEKNLGVSSARYSWSIGATKYETACSICSFGDEQQLQLQNGEQ